ASFGSACVEQEVKEASPAVVVNRPEHPCRIISAKIDCRFLSNLGRQVFPSNYFFEIGRVTPDHRLPSLNGRCHGGDMPIPGLESLPEAHPFRGLPAICGHAIVAELTVTACEVSDSLSGHWQPSKLAKQIVLLEGIPGSESGVRVQANRDEDVL